jgi:hypothetical protein
MSDDLTEKLMALVSATPSIEELEARITELEAERDKLEDDLIKWALPDGHTVIDGQVTTLAPSLRSH